jgi:hypothetical protein
MSLCIDIGAIDGYRAVAFDLPGSCTGVHDVYRTVYTQVSCQEGILAASGKVGIG